eukprot:scaffold33467_cov129-Isochrysis_galbana.AAC.2
MWRRPTRPLLLPCPHACMLESAAVLLHHVNRPRPAAWFTGACGLGIRHSCEWGVNGSHRPRSAV